MYDITHASTILIGAAYTHSSTLLSMYVYGRGVIDTYVTD